MRFQFMRMAIIKKTNTDKDVEKEELIYCWWECKLVRPLRKTIWKFLRKTTKITTYVIQRTTLGIFPKEMVLVC